MSAINNMTGRLAAKQLRRLQLKEQLNAKNLKNEENAARQLFETATRAESAPSAPPINFGVPLSEHSLNHLPFLSQDMGVYIEVIVEKLLQQNPMLAMLFENLSSKLDEKLTLDENEKVEGNDESASDESVSDESVSDESVSLSEGGITELVEGGATSFEAYVLLYEYYLKRKRFLKDDKRLKDILAELNGIEQTETLDILQNLKNFNQETTAKFKLIKEFKSRANSYHGEYSEILQQVTSQYDGNFRAMLKDMLKLCGYNLTNLASNSLREYEEQAKLAERVYLETKLLNLTSLFCKLETAGAKLNPEVMAINPLQLTRDLIDLLDGFDCNRLIANKCKTILDPLQKKACSIQLLNLNIEAVRYLPVNFFKQSKDRENLSLKLKDSSILKQDSKKGIKKFI